MKRIAPIFALALSTACAAKSADTAEPAATKAATDAPTRAGTYSLSTSDFVATPSGCRDSEGDDHEAWSLEMADPAGGKWLATERYGDKTNPYDCANDGEGFSCTSEAGFDYGVTGVDADVKLDIRYDGDWGDPGSIAGSYELAFTCEGAQCGEVAAQWGVNSFPCSNEGTFEGSR